jgi:hypothetical protein
MVISSIGTAPNNFGNGFGTLAINISANPGDLRLMFFKTGSGTVTVSSVAGGNAAIWKRFAGPSNFASHNWEVWGGVVTTAGTGNATATYTAGASGVNCVMHCQTFTASDPRTVWSPDTGKYTTGTAAATTALLFQPATATGQQALYMGYSQVSSGGFSSGGGTPTGTWNLQQNLNGDGAIFNTNVGPGLAQGTCTISSSTSAGIALIVTANIIQYSEQQNPAGSFNGTMTNAVNRASFW